MRCFALLAILLTTQPIHAQRIDWQHANLHLDDSTLPATNLSPHQQASIRTFILHTLSDDCSAYPGGPGTFTYSSALLGRPHIVYVSPDGRLPPRRSRCERLAMVGGHLWRSPPPHRHASARLRGLGPRHSAPHQPPPPRHRHGMAHERLRNPPHLSSLRRHTLPHHQPNLPGPLPDPPRPPIRVGPLRETRRHALNSGTYENLSRREPTRETLPME
jgi:hypothetical protein